MTPLFFTRRTFAQAIREAAGAPKGGVATEIAFVDGDQPPVLGPTPEPRRKGYSRLTVTVGRQWLVNQAAADIAELTKEKS